MAGPQRVSPGEPVAKKSAVLDASVLVQEPVRSLLLWIATAGGFEPYWTERILDEVGRNLLAESFVTAEQWARLHAALREHFAESFIDQVRTDEHEADMPNQEKDRHVLAAAVASDVELVVTNNLKHFPAADLSTVGKRSCSGDDFLSELLDAYPNIVREALREQVKAMRNPWQWTESELLGRLAGLGEGDALAPQFAQAAAARYGITLGRPPPKPQR